jgi:hypothetical protein
MPLAMLIQEGCVGRHLVVFQCTQIHSCTKFKFWELLDRTMYVIDTTELWEGGWGLVHIWCQL